MSEIPSGTAPPKVPPGHKFVGYTADGGVITTTGGVVIDDAYLEAEEQHARERRAAIIAEYGSEEAYTEHCIAQARRMRAERARAIRRMRVDRARARRISATIEPTSRDACPGHVNAARTPPAELRALAPAPIPETLSQANHTRTGPSASPADASSPGSRRSSVVRSSAAPGGGRTRNERPDRQRSALPR
jgi:hypothetical protein